MRTSLGATVMTHTPHTLAAITSHILCLPILHHYLSIYYYVYKLGATLATLGRSDMLVCRSRWWLARRLEICEKRLRTNRHPLRVRKRLLKLAPTFNRGCPVAVTQQRGRVKVTL